MRRRAFIGALVRAAAMRPLTARAPQSGKIWRLGFLSPRSQPSPTARDAFSDAFLQGIHELGYSEGKNLLVEWCYAQGDTIASVGHSRLAAQTRMVQG